MGEDVVDERVRVRAGELGSGGCGDEVDVDEGSEPVLSREDAPEAVLEEELVDGDERPAGVVREPEELVGRRRVGRERLLDDHVRAGRERDPDDFGVGVERRADVDDVDLVRGKRGLEVDVGRPDAQSHGGRELTVDDGDDRSVRATGSGRVPAPHRACADDRRAHALPAPFAGARHAATLLPCGGANAVLGLGLESPGGTSEGGKPPEGVWMAEDQRRARVFGVLLLITFVTSIPALALYQPVLDDPVGYIAGGGEDTQILLGVLLELLLIIADIGTAVVMFPIVRRQNEVLSLGYVTARLVECIFIAVGILFVLGIVILRKDGPDLPRRQCRSLRSRTGRSCSDPASSSVGGTD